MTECNHEWGIDGMHQNEYCKKCFISKDYETIDPAELTQVENSGWLDCPFCGEKAFGSNLCYDDERLIKCKNSRCGIYDKLMKESTWNRRAN